MNNRGFISISDWRANFYCALDWLKPLFLVSLLVYLIFAMGAPGAVAGSIANNDMEWTAEISVAFPPDQVQALGGREAVDTLQNALASRLRNRGVAVEFKPRARGDSGAYFDLSISGKGGLEQFKQVFFDDLTPVGGLLGGPVSLTLTGDISQGETVPLTLEVNLTAGYQWVIAQMDQAALRQSGNFEFKSKSDLLGAPANQIVRVQGVKAGAASIAIVYRRPWESDAELTRRITIRASRLSTIADLSNPAPSQKRPEESQPQEKPLTLTPTVGVPPSFDWRTTGKVTSVRDQGACGSCWAFGTVAPFESNLLIKQNLTSDLAEQYLVSCNRNGWSCNGGWWAHDYHVSKYFAPQTQAGAVLESDAPYTATNGSCTVAYNHPYRLGRWAYVGNSSSIPTPDAIKNAIYTYGPVAVAICVGNAFQAYSGGIFTTNETSACNGGINHAVTLVGWDDAQQYWIMKNSWGPRWGESGYMRIRWNTSNIGYAANYVDSTALPPPANDDFNNAIAISSLPYTTTEDTTTATTAPDDPSFTCASGQKNNTVWWRFTPSQSGALTVDTFGSGYDTVLAVWTGSRGSLTSVGCNDDTNGLQSRVQVSVTQGQTYYIEVASYSSGGGQLTLNVSMGTPVCYNLSKSANPSSGGSVNANPAPNCNSGTQYNPGTIVTLTATPNSGYVFSSWSGDVSGTANPTTVTMNANKSVTANFAATPPPPANDDFNTPTVISSPPYTVNEDTTGATTASDDPRFTCVSSQKHNTVWWRYAPSQSGMLTVDTFGSNYDTVLGVWTGSRGSLTSMGCNDDANGTLQSRVQVSVTQGQTYYIEVASYNPGGGQLTLHATVPAPTNWVIKASMSVARSRSAVASVNGKVYVIGGESGAAAKLTPVVGQGTPLRESLMPNAWERTIEEYTPGTNTWATKTPKPTGASNIGAGVINGKIYVPGGWDGTSALSVLEIYDPVTNSWTTGAALPAVRSGYAAAVANNKLYVMGGRDGTGYVNTCFAYDPATNSWSSCAAMPSARAWAGAGVVNGKIYVVGGVDATASDYNTVQEYNPATNAWQTRTPMSTARGGPGAVGVGNYLYVCGGGWSTFLGTCEKYDPAANTWSSFDTMNVGRRTLGLVEANNKLYAEAGYKGTYSADNEENALGTSVCYTLTTSANPSGGGSVSASPVPNCNGTQYTSGTVVTLTANANSGYAFSSWSGDASGTTNPTTVTMSANKNVTANFSACYTLIIIVNPSGGGNVSLSPAPNCYNPGTIVTLAAIPNSGYVFSNWGGDVNGTTNPTTLTMNANKSVTANFVNSGACYTLTTSANPSGSGSVSASPAPNCNSGAQYTSGTVVTLTANANSGYAFSNWSGDASGTTNPTTVTMNANKNVTANFLAASVVLAINPVASTVAVGQNFSVTVQMRAGSQQVDGAAAYLDFDPTRLQVISVTPGTTLPNLLQNTYNNTTGQIDFAAGDLNPPYPSGTFTVATITFRAISQTTGTSVAFSVTAPRKSDVTFGGISVLSQTENGTVVVTNSATLNGHVTLQGRPTPPNARWVTPLTVTLTIPGESSPRYTFTPTTDDRGYFVLNNIAPGTYDVRVKNSHTLQNKVTTTLLVGVTNTVDFGTLREGDANNDNVVTLIDFSILASTFAKCQGTTGYDDRADFNEDQCVTLLDFSLLASNFGQGGQAPRPILRPTKPKAGTVGLGIVPSTVMVTPGQVFTLTVQAAAGAQQVDGVQASLDFNPAYVRVRQLTPGAGLPLIMQNQYDNTAGKVDYAAGTVSNFPSGTFTFVQIQFEALATTSGTPLTFHLGAPRNSDVTFGGASVLGGASDGTIVILSSANQIFLPLISR